MERNAKKNEKNTSLTFAITAQIAKFMGPIWGPPGSCRTQVGPMLGPFTLLSGCACWYQVICKLSDYLILGYEYVLDGIEGLILYRCVCCGCVKYITINDQSPTDALCTPYWPLWRHNCSWWRNNAISPMGALRVADGSNSGDMIDAR